MVTRTASLLRQSLFLFFRHKRCSFSSGNSFPLASAFVPPTPTSPSQFGIRDRSRSRVEFTVTRPFFQTHRRMGQGVEIVTEGDDGSSYILDRSPADGKLIQKVKCSTQRDVDDTIQALKDRQRIWRAVPLDRRVEIVRLALEAAFESEDGSTEKELATLISTEMGKTLAESEEEVGELVGLKGEPLTLIHEANKPEEVNNALIVRDPLGVIAVLSPWNFPAGEIMLHVVPALVAGNAVLVKPSEVTPLTGEFLVRKLRSFEAESKVGGGGGVVEIPIGIAQGDGRVGEMIVNHPDVSSISMTGSSATGKKIMQSCGKDLKRMILELGGKDPMVVFSDADLKLAAKDAVECSTANAGQVCCSVERIYVDKSVKGKFEELVVEECKKVTAGPFDNEATTMGPMVSKMQKEQVEEQVADAVTRGAKKLYTGQIVASEDQIAGGNYCPATVLTDLTPDMQISTAETFGPVVALYEFDGSEEKAIELANDTKYGLSASVYSTDLEKCTRVASNIQAGQVGVNAWSLVYAPTQCPWIGHKESGHGYHSGRDGYRQFSVPKSIVFRNGDVGMDEEKDRGYYDTVTKEWTVEEMAKTATHQT